MFQFVLRFFIYWLGFLFVYIDWSFRLVITINSDTLADKQEERLATNFENPDCDGLHFCETFQEDFSVNSWVKSGDELYIGDWSISRRQVEGIIGDFGLRAENEGQHHAISTFIEPILSNKNQHLVVQYEVKFENGLQCGGAYIKLFYLPISYIDTGRKNPKLLQFNGFTNYVIMFGPDKCGSTNKVQFILKYFNETTDIWSEHHFKNSPEVPDEMVTHLYNLWIRPDDTFQISVDNREFVEGDFHYDMEPPIVFFDDNEIENSSNNENEPQYIDDPTDHMPEGWLEDEEMEILDSSAKKPEDWNEEVRKNGKWNGLMIENPKCLDAVGCGKWEPRKIKNPRYAVSKKRDIDPSYKVMHALDKINAIGFEIWTMQHGIIFDNIIISRDYNRAKKFSEETWKIREKKERILSHKGKNLNNHDYQISTSGNSGFMNNLMEFFFRKYNEYPLELASTLLCGGLLTILLISKLFRRKNSMHPHISSSSIKISD